MGTLEKETQKCIFCGKEYVATLIKLPESLAKQLGKTEIKNYHPACHCETDYEAELEKQEIARQKQEALNKRFSNSLMTPFFRKKVFENLKPTKEIEYCKNYVENFDKSTSKGIQMIGDVGTGKTTLLAAICNELINKGYTCLFTTFSELIESFLTFSSTNSGDITNKLNWLTNFDVVVLDDVGRESYNTERKKEISFRIIDTLLNYEIITCFSANPEMIERLKNIPEQRAALDRLKDMCPNKLSFKGESLRGNNNNVIKMYGN